MLLQTLELAHCFDYSCSWLPAEFQRGARNRKAVMDPTPEYCMKSNNDCVCESAQESSQRKESRLFGMQLETETDFKNLIDLRLMFRITHQRVLYVYWMVYRFLDQCLFYSCLNSFSMNSFSIWGLLTYMEKVLYSLQ